ncbi:tetratricopeptide repeat protein [Paractinoplanes lichenicola]|uniref:Tetratricopeptide repeat protein n=1 Tax=Paractinoplanes lichenicola TaxID=2802976 RepID=A0ABS1W681_9ACTN|nr:tetratricopeptide repeat protein [Actinoplanes lichenicola]MBL7262193.1 tetratricopeptide repeat protein [Actinoplanes lichenicola]
MIDIEVREVSAAEDGSFGVRVDFGDGGGADVTVSAVADDATEKLLTWYFEEHLRYPFLDKDLERQAAAAVAEYGRTLFRQVFTGEAAFGYRRAFDVGFEGYRLVVRGSAGFQRLHWETLCDHDRGERLALRMPIVRQDSRVPLHYRLPDPAATLNILVVTARPFGSRDVGYRLISQPLLEAIGRTTMPVTVDLVRPGTWEALRDTLRAAARDRGQGWYQVIHFDLHGGFGAPDEFAAGAVSGRYLFDPASAPGQGRQGFLFFETGEAGVARPVPSAEVARLLAEHRVAVAVLNACQSAMQHGNEASLAQDLVAAGAPVAIGMAYSVTVSAAKQAMPVFYGRLAAGDDPVAAAFEARRALHDTKARRGHFEQDFDLEDWILPVVFAQRESRLSLRPMTSPESNAFYQRREQVSVAPAVEYGFVGRDLDLHALERLLLIDPHAGQALVRGMAGAGKSTLLAHAGWWWQRTGLVNEVFLFSYEERAWTAEQIVRQIARHLLTAVEFAEWEALTPAAKTGLITERLRAGRHLIIIDNAESITASPAAIPHALPDAERDRLARLLAGLQGGRTLVLVGSREAETWLARSTFAGRVYDLPGLDPQAAADLLERILDRHGGTQWLSEATDQAQREALTELIRLLDGYPLPMTVVMPQLATTPPAQVLADLRVGRDSADPTMVARRAIEYSHGKLDPALQSSILLLAPFTTSIPVPVLETYVEALRTDPAGVDLDGVDLPAAVAELRRVGLAAEHSTMAGFVQIVPILPYFLRARLRDNPAVEQTCDRGHYALYTSLAGAFEAMLTDNDPRQRATGQAAVKAEYANLTAAIEYAQHTRQPVLRLIRAVNKYLDQTQQHDTRRSLLEIAIARHPAAETPDEKWELLDLHNMAGHTAIIQHRLDDAARHYTSELAMKQALGKRSSEAVTYHQLGRVAEERRLFEQAEEHYRQALDILLEFGDRHGAARTYHQLGLVAHERRLFEQAEQHCRQALDILLEFGDRHSAANTYHQLGAVAYERRLFEQAEQHCRQALDILLEFGDRHGAASTYHQLGAVAHERRRFEQAEQHYRQALDILLEFGDRHGAARTYHQLGAVAHERRRFEQAEQHCRQALDISLEFGDRHGAARTYHQLGAVAHEQRRFEQAEQHYRQALDILLEFGDRHGAARTYHQLGMVAHEQRRFEQAEQHYRQALDIKLEFGDRHGAANTYNQLGALLAELNQHHPACTALLHAAAAWHASTGAWPTNTLDLLRQERSHLSDSEFQQAIAEVVPVDLRGEFDDALQEGDGIT